MAPAEKRVEIVARIHPAELAQHLRLVATLERHHPFPFTFQSCFSRGVPCSGPAAPCSAGRALGPASSSQAPLAGQGAPGQGRRRWPEPAQHARAREPVLRPLRRAPFWAALVCFWNRAAGLVSWALVAPVRALGALRPAVRARVPEPAPQHLAQALEERRPPHFQPFNWNKDFIARGLGKSRNSRWSRECSLRFHQRQSA